ncbi:unnamed protein product [Haemonchus placei]|uniref:RRM domain-containing protein n=1 Tax=Haemonchus placei TaxID=6290 RepID=A0A0N4W3N1_HAEPC|nr:unnamed protein product [Haemonchus placei]
MAMMWSTHFTVFPTLIILPWKNWQVIFDSILLIRMLRISSFHHHGNKQKGINKASVLYSFLELTAVMSRFELDVIEAGTPQRVRSKSDPSPMVRLPRTVVVKSFESVNERSDQVFNLCTNITLYPNVIQTGAVADPCCKGYMWSGELPPRNYSNPMFSSKIFVGGVPWDISETALIDAFSPYGACRVEWPSREGRSHSSQRSRTKSCTFQATGYVYIVFETERSVKSLLQDCSQEFGSAGEWYFKLKARRNQSSEIRQVQVIPWVVSDSSFSDGPTCIMDPKKTVFVGALHGMITAHVLFSIMNELYGNVAFVGIDTDKYKYPIGSGRVTFYSHSSYFHAIESAFLEIRTSKFCKRVQIDPFLEDSYCMVCFEYPGPYFCRDRTCFRYYCATCWQVRLAKSIALDSLSVNDCPYTVPSVAAVAPLGGMAAVAAVAQGTVPRHQRHAYQYMQLAPSYPSAVFSPTMMQQRCRMGSNMTPAPLVAGQAVTSPTPFIHQRLY